MNEHLLLIFDVTFHIYHLCQCAARKVDAGSAFWDRERLSRPWLQEPVTAAAAAKNSAFELECREGRKLEVMVRQKLLSKPTCGPTGLYTEKLKYSDVIIISGCPRLRPRAGCTQPRHKSPPCRTTSITAPDWGGQKTRYVSNI